MMTKIWKFLKISVLISFLFIFSALANGIEKITVGVDKNYYKVFIKLSHPTKIRVVKDLKRDLLALEFNNKSVFSKSFYSVLIQGSRNLITILVKNPKLDLSRAVVREIYDSVYVFIPFRREFAKYTVVIDPGHGGKDSGAVYRGVKEKNINFAIAEKLYALLSRDGRFRVYMTRMGDYFVSLGDRQKFAAKVGADLFISIHANAAPRNPDARGVEFFILSNKGKYQKYVELYRHPEEAMEFFSPIVVKNSSLRKKLIKSTLQITQDEGEEVAEMLCDEWRKYMSKYIPCHGIYERAFAVLKVPGVPTVLVETGFMTNRKDLAYLTSSYYQWKIAESLYMGILDYFNLKPPDWIKEKLKN